MKKIISLLLTTVMCVVLFTGCGGAAVEEKGGDSSVPVDFRIASLKGPTTMGMVKLMKDSEEGNCLHNYEFNMYGTADEIVPQLINGDIDVALVPCNLAGVLYNKTEGALQVAAINTLGVLYIVENGNTINSVNDLEGKTIYSTGKGTTPEFALNYILKQNGLVPGEDLKLEYKSEATEVALLLEDLDEAIAVLPQPYVTAVQMQNDRVRVALDMTEEWEKVSTDSSMVTGVLLVRKAFAEENQEAFDEFLEEYKASTSYVNSNVEEAAALVEEYGIVAKAPIAVKAIPECNITYIDGQEMKTKINGYLSVLYEANPQSVGGSVPEDDFYYQKAE